MPSLVPRIDDLVAQGAFGVPVAKHQNRAAIMTVGGPLGWSRRIDIGVETPVGFAIRQHDHLRGLNDLRLLHFWPAVHITSQAFVAERRGSPPVVVAERKTCGLADTPRIPPSASEVGRAERLVHVCVPLAVALGCRTPKHSPVRSQLGEEPGWPHVPEAALGEETARVLSVVLHIHHRRDAQLAHAVEASSLLSFCFRFAQCRQQETGQDGDDRDDHQEFNQRKRQLATLPARNFRFGIVHNSAGLILLSHNSNPRAPTCQRSPTVESTETYSSYVPVTSMLWEPHARYSPRRKLQGSKPTTL